MEQIFYNGKILTMGKNNEKEEISKAPEAVWIKDGIIAATGEFDKLVKMAGDKVIVRDLKGKCVMPSFIDSHSHFIMSGQALIWADLSACESFDEIIIVLREYMKKKQITKDGVIIGFGYDHNFLKEGGQPDRRILDKVSPQIPILVLHVSAHLACANSAALELAGIDDRTSNPPGGIIGRIEGSNEPNGYLEEGAISIVQGALVPRIKINYAEMINELQELYIANGVTTVQDGASTEKDIKFLAQISDLGSLKIDVVAYPLMPANGKALMMEYGEKYRNYVNRFKIGGYKLVLDGSPQGRTAWMKEPYLGGETNYCGYPWMKDSVVEEYVKDAIKEKKQILAHCNGDAASEQFLNAYNVALAETGCDMNLRPVMIHCQTVRNEQLDRMSKINMVASIFVGHVWYWGNIHLKNLGLERGKRISPVKDAIDRKVKVTFHQDTPVTKPNMLHSVWCAVNRISRSGDIIGAEQAVTVYEALKAVTINAAYQYFEEEIKGSIEAGKKADLIILDQSPLEVDKKEIRNIKILETIKEGKTIYADK